MFKRYAIALAVITAIGSTPLEASERWTDQRDPQFGFSFSFPQSEFASVEGDGKPGFHYFAADHEKRPLTTVRFDVINVVRGYGPTLNRTFSALGFLGEPVPSDRFPNR